MYRQWCSRAQARYGIAHRRVAGGQHKPWTDCIGRISLDHFSEQLGFPYTCILREHDPRVFEAEVVEIAKGRPKAAGNLHKEPDVTRARSRAFNCAAAAA